MPWLSSFKQYWHTLEHLRPEQVGGQLWVRMRPIRRWLEHFQTASPGPYPGSRINTNTPWLPPPEGENTRTSCLQGTLCFLHQPHPIGWPPDWFAPTQPKLWQYNLHYFEWMWLLSWEEAVFVVQDWINFTQKHREHPGWEPYPTCLRLLNWCGFFFHEHHKRTLQHPEFLEHLWQSVHHQAHWLLHHLEFHLMGNHLFENAATLALLGSQFVGEQARSWREKGLDLLRQELQEQILPDGLHFELSPMYHSRILALMLLLARHGDTEIAALVQPYLPSMLRALRHLCHPDGQIALLNDSALGIYHDPAVLFSFGQEFDTPPTTGVWNLPDAGYYGIRTPDHSYVVCDVGIPGPDYIPGHAHGDLLSFELSLRGHRIVVDSGVHDYTHSPMRQYCRSTQAHNTVEMEGQDQSEFWGAFRVARRAHPHDVLWSHHHTEFELQAWHDGYLRLPQHARHERRFQWTTEGHLRFWDRITAQQSVRMVSRLHLHPACSIVSQTSHQAEVQSPVGVVRISFHGPGELLPPHQEESWYCPKFGSIQPNPVLRFRSIGRNLSIQCKIE